MDDDAGLEFSRGDILRLAAHIVSSYAGANKVSSSQIAEAIGVAFCALSNLGKAANLETKKPAIPIARSVMPDYIVCLEDGKKLKMLKRHLRAAFGLTPGEYRSKWNLPKDYPMVAPNYAKRRSDFAKQFGLGRTGSGKAAGGRAK